MKEFSSCPCVSGYFPELEPTPKPLGIVLRARKPDGPDREPARKLSPYHWTPANEKRCPRCLEVYPREDFKDRRYCPDCISSLASSGVLPA